jgi:hypothetical protein
MKGLGRIVSSYQNRVNISGAGIEDKGRIRIQIRD